MIVFYQALDRLINLIEVLILIRIILSVINIGLDNFVGKIIFNMTEPILFPARELLKKLNINTGMFDFSPLLALLFLRVFYNVIGRMIFL